MENNDCEIISACFFKTQCPLVILNKQGFPVAWNSAIDEFLLRNNAKTFVSKDKNFWSSVKQMLLPEETERLNAFIRGDKTYWEVEVKYKPLGEQSMWYKLEAFPVKDGDFVFCLIRDNTNHHIREMQLVEEKLDAERAVFSRTQFLANMSHEIRTPIQTIVGTTDLLEDTQLDDEQREYIHQVKFGADILLSLVNDILDFSKMEAGQLVLEETPFRLEMQVEKTLDLITLEAHKKHLDLILDFDRALPKVITGDPWRLNQVILNLIKNAIKFTTEGSITLKVFPIQKQNGLFIEFRIIDTGIGISPEHKDNLFSSFYQGDTSTTRKYGGTGLGLSISKNLIDMMNGDISCEVNSTKGSTFRFAIPAISPVANPEPSFISPQKNMRVLVVDDDVHAAALLTKRLFEFGFKNIQTASSGENALQLLRRAANDANPFRIAFIDMVMPNMDGWRLSAEINKDKNINNVLLYLVMQEGLLHQDAKRKILEWFNGYFYKPIKYHQLERVIQNIDFDSFNLEVVNDTDYKQVVGRPSLLHHAQSLRIITNVPPKNEPVPTEQPKNTTAPALQIQNPQPDYGFKPLHVLIVEDHPVNRRLLRTMLAKIGVGGISEAENGRIAVTAVHNQVPDLIFMDLQMPEMNGFESSLQIRKDGFTMPIIACTASVLGDEFSHCKDCGMNDIIMKPFKKTDIIEKLQKWRTEK